MTTDSEALFKQIAEKFNIPLPTIKNLFTLFHGDLKPRMSKEYLAYIISAMEKIAREITENPFFIIELHPLNIKDKLPVSSSAYHHEKYFDIFYPENLDEKQKMFIIALELAHLYFELRMRHLPGDLANGEELCAVFAIIALNDQSQFYSEKTEEHTYKHEGKLIDMARLLHDKMVKRN